ncbi:unnamed protein product [Nyctereutes procyonoides]|uniref:(raccoon dog) hypothetical protein n=1 Tax=Nyctereutes procyonoides TaxID=34880 RepID=A0A811ZV83_NYCPR|nr:major allergen I polypeptide chain 2-like [Nyctereutes procyonoides]CAD7692812.1 unnamed protein product [Nyctereutes procyonoides]
MKGTLLVLTLLVTQDLGIEMAKACPLFYSVFGTLAIGKEFPLNKALRLANATEAEKAAIGKIQDCYNEKGLDAKILDLIVMTTITTSKKCIYEAMDSLKETFHIAPLGR